MTDPRHAMLHALLSRLVTLPDSEWEDFAAGLQLAKLATGDALVRCGAPSERLAFVVKGAVKASYQTRKGVEYIRNFAIEGMLVGPYVSFLQRAKEAEVDIIAIEPTELLVFSQDHYRHFLTRHPVWQHIGRVVAEQLYIVRERRQFEFHTMSAAERLDDFIEKQPKLIGRIAQKDLASYLGMTPETLSRLRAKAKKRPPSP